MLDPEVWNEELPLTALNAYHLLIGLEIRTMMDHRKDHEILPNQDAFAKNPEPKPSRKHQRGVDMEIIRGTAFV